MRDGTEESLPGWVALGPPPTVTLAPTSSRKELAVDDSAMGATIETAIASKYLLISAPDRFCLGALVSVGAVPGLMWRA